MSVTFPDILDALRDLHRQATVERSHYYTGQVIHAAMAEIEKLRDENANLDSACKIADRKNEALHDLLTAASGAHEFLSGGSFADWPEATEANIHRERLEQAIEQAKASMK